MCITRPIIVKSAIGLGWLKWWSFRDWIRNRRARFGEARRNGLPRGGGSWIGRAIGAVSGHGGAGVGGEQGGSARDGGIAGGGVAKLANGLPADAEGAADGGVGADDAAEVAQQSKLFGGHGAVPPFRVCIAGNAPSQSAVDNAVIGCDYRNVGGDSNPRVTPQGEPKRPLTPPTLLPSVANQLPEVAVVAAWRLGACANLLKLRPYRRPCVVATVARDGGGGGILCGVDSFEGQYSLAFGVAS